MESSFYLPIFLIAGGIIFLIIFFHYVPFFLWLSAKVSGVNISLIQLFLMRIRNVPPYIIVPGMIEAHKAGLKNITRDELEAHYLAGGHVEKVVHALVSASKANIELPFQMATAIDLAGRDVFEAVQMSVNPKVIDTPPVTAVAKDGIQLIAKARVTVRANIRQLVGGAGEDTILARVGEGIVSSIGSSENHKSVLENPDSISKLVLRKGLDAGTAFEILSIDIADIDIGKNIGAALQIDQANADKNIAQAKAEERRAMAVASEQEMKAKAQEARAKVIEAEAEVPMNLETTKKLSDMVTDDMRKAGKLLVSESGVSDTDDIKLLAKSRVDALLIGTVLMEAENPCELISEFKCIYDNECEKEELDENGKKTEVKICGITSEADARLLIKYGADYGGMVVFYPKSKRDITIDEAGRLVKILKESDIKTVAVTVSPDTDKLRQIQDNGFDYIQIHGELYEDVYNESRIPFIRAVNIGKNDNMDDIKKSVSEAAHKDKIVGILLDAGIPGSGKTFDWNGVKELELKEKKLFLAGGLNSLNVAAAVKCAMPDVVDISTGVEYDDILIKGKDEKKVKEFILNARK